MKILILALPCESHVKPFLHFFRVFGSLSHDVVLYVREKDSHWLKGSGIETKFYNQYFLDNIYLMNRNVSLSDTASRREQHFNPDFEKRVEAASSAYLFRIRCMKKYIKELNEDFSQYDLIIYDYYLFFGHFIAETYHIPSVSLLATLIPAQESIIRQQMNHFLYMTYFLQTDEVLEEECPLLDVFQRESQAIAGRIKLPYDYFSSGFSSVNLVSTSSELYPYKIREGERQVKFLGRTSALEHPTGGELLSDAFFGEMPEIFVYLGEIEEHYAPILKKVIEIYAKTEYRICFAYRNFLNYESPAFLETLPDNIKAQPYFPLEEMLPYLKLYVCHGGLSGIQEALVYGVPVIVIPTSGERKLDGIRIQELGAGFSIHADCESVERELAEDTRRALTEPQFARNSKKLGEGLEKDAQNVRRIAEDLCLLVK